MITFLKSNYRFIIVIGLTKGKTFLIKSQVQVVYWDKFTIDFIVLYFCIWRQEDLSKVYVYF